MQETPVVTCFLRHRGEVLLLRRSEAVGSYQGRWGGVAGHVEGDPDAAAMQEIEEETGLHRAVTLARRGEPFAVEDEALGTRWIVHPYLFDCDSRDARLDWETTEAAWVAPTEILRRDTVPQLWTSYDHVAPSLASIRTDAAHGAAYLSLRTLEVLRDRAGWLRHQATEAAWDDLRALARQALGARPSMAALRNRVNRVMHACRHEASAAAVEREAHAALGKALDDDAEAARRAAGYASGRRVLTLSRSGTVLDALRQADPAPTRVLVAASEPGGEGVGVAEALASQGMAVTLVPDAALATVCAEEQVDVVLFGADTVLPSGGVVNKIGTRQAAMAAREHRLPCYAAAASDKVSPDEATHLEAGDPAALYRGEAPLEVFTARFEVTPARLLSGVITEVGLLAPPDLRDLAFELKALAAW